MPTPNGPVIRRAAAALCRTLIASLVLAASQADAVQTHPAAGSSVGLEVGKGTLVRLDRPANAVFVADPEICDVQLTSPRLVYLLAKKPGRPACTPSTRPRTCSPTWKSRLATT
jgi:pilus assembly protein CpaC